MSCSIRKTARYLNRLTMKRDRAKKAKLLIPNSGDRLHVYQAGQFIETLGVGPGATSEVASLNLGAGDVSVVVLADVLGRGEGGTCYP